MDTIHRMSIDEARRRYGEDQRKVPVGYYDGFQDGARQNLHHVKISEIMTKHKLKIFNISRRWSKKSVANLLDNIWRDLNKRFD